LNVTLAQNSPGLLPAGHAAAARRYVHMRASTADLERSIEVLKRSFAEGRLTKDELDERVGQALVSRFFAELMQLTDDLPVGIFGRLPAHPATSLFRRRRFLVGKPISPRPAPGL
jgi:Domain of unknown function (DUF1707)